MAGPRSKRKRTETEAVPSASRRHRRDPTSSGPERVSKNEVKPVDAATVVTGAGGDAAAAIDQVTPRQAKTTEIKSEKFKDHSTKNLARLGPKPSSDNGNDHAHPEENQVKNGPLHQNQPDQSAPIPRRAQKVLSEKSSDAPVRGGLATGEKSNSGVKQSRDKKIRALVSHRKLLLERLQQGRTAAQKRLHQLEEEEPTRKSESGEEERQRFSALSKEITSLARKQSKVEVTGDDGIASTEKRTQLSLRRGSSVGKRMNAALSSLAPGSSIQQPTSTAIASVSASISTSLEAAPAAKSAQAVPAPTGNNLPVVSSGAQISQPLITKVTTIPVAAASVPPPISSTVLPAPAVAPAAAKVPTGTAATASKKSATTGPPLPTPVNVPIQVGRGVSQKALHRQLGQHQNVPTPRAASIKQAPLQLPIPTHRSMPPANIMGIPSRRPLPLVVVVPEAMALRDRRKAIENKLIQLTRRRIDQQAQPEQLTRAPNSTALPDYAREFAAYDAIPAPKLPKRRRTHWDTLLDEMRWLATDFLEERKWKVNVARAVAKEVNSFVERRQKKDSVGASYECGPKENELGKPRSEKTNLIKEVNQAKDDGNCTAVVITDRQPNTGEKDEIKLRDIARISASIVSDFWCSSQDGSQIFESTNDTEKPSNTGSIPASPVAVDQTQSSLVAQNSVSNPEKKHEELDEISQNFDQLLKVFVAVRKAETKPKSFGVDLLAHQVDGVAFMDDAWKKGSVGSLLSGPVSSGKTFTTCSILWKNKSSGPQLVVCSADSLVKWFDELSYFDGIDAVGVSSDIRSDWASAVVICTFSDFEKIKKEVLSQFRTIVVDSRYPVGFRGSRPKICLDSYENASHSLTSASAPKELASTDWWEKAVFRIMESNARRILVDVFNSADLLGLFDGFSDRAILEHLSLRAAFLFGQAVFPSTWNFSKKNMLEWARRHIKRMADGTGSKFIKVRNLFRQMLDTVTFRLVSETHAKPSVEDILCDMTPWQRSTYNLCCKNVKAALSRRLELIDTSSVQFAFRSIADALMRLRRICTHADSLDILNNSSARRHLLAHSFTTLEKCSALEPDADLASLIMAGSGKLSELSRILVHEGGIQLDKTIQDACQISPPASTTASHSKRTKKVAILAVLPEVQLLVSLLLGALGICHEVLLKCHTASNSNAKSSVWLATQHVLSRFNNKMFESSRMVNVIVASPIVVAGNHGGLGVESADLVVLVDEDWSGRGELLMRSLLSRVSLGKEQAECKLFRLISRNSCEENFCASTPGTDSPSDDSKLPWPVSAFGLFHPPRDLRSFEESIVKSNWISMGYLKGVLVFPGKGLFACSNRDLEKVLGHDSSSRPLFGAHSCPRFLPSSSGSLAIETQICLIKSLSKSESESSTFSIYLKACRRLASVIPPFPNNFDLHVSQRGLSGSPMLHFVQRFRQEVEVDAREDSDKLVLSLSPQPSGSDLKADNIVDLQVGNHDDRSDREALAGGLLYYDNTGFSGLSDTGYNIFASSFRLSTSLQYTEGSQGMELLVYFPPLFPRLLESSIIAESVQSQKGKVSGMKRPANGEDPTAVKRLKLDDGGFLPICLTAEGPSVVTEENASQNDAAAVLFDLTDDYGLAGIGAIPLPRDSALFAGQIMTESGSKLVSTMTDSLCMIQPIDHEEVEEMRTHNANSLTDPQSLILFVARKRHRGQMGMQAFQLPLRPQQNVVVPWGPLAVASSVPQNPPPSNGLYGTNGIDSGEKQKKKLLQEPSVGASMFARSTEQQPVWPPASVVLPNTTHNLKTKDIHRSRLIAASRQLGHGFTLFDASPFRTAAVRLRNKMGYRLSRLCWQSGTAYETGPGLPLSVSKPLGRSQIFRSDFEADPAIWTSVVKRLKNSNAATGDEAVEVANAQSTDLHRSLSAPTRVDFGPFKSGFLYLPSGMTAISPPRPSVGVTLPMGVKLPQTIKDQLVPWTVQEEVLLKSTIMRFGTNFTLSSRVLSGLQDVLTVSRQPQVVRNVSRAAKSCKDHWQILTRSDPGLAMEVKRVERTQRESSTLKFCEPYEPHVRHEIVGTRHDTSDMTGGRQSVLVLLVSKETSDEVSMTTKETSEGLGTPGEKGCSSQADVARRRSFSAIASARKKIQEGPNAIPGITEGGSQNIAPSHSSHMQSVQSSVASSWTSGRTEMWPLQFLDAADRFRASQAQQQTAASTSAPSRSPPQSALAPASRQHSATMPLARTASTGIPPIGHQPAVPTNTSQRPVGGNSYPPPARSDSRTQSSMPHVFAPPPSQPTRTPSAARSSSVSGGSPARK